MSKQYDVSKLGPLKNFIGVWTGAGTDYAPGKNYRKGDQLIAEDYIQELTLEPMPILTYSAADQTVLGLRYLGKIWAVNKDNTDKFPSMFPVYEENGYALWIPSSESDGKTGTIVRQVSNPRGLSFMAKADNIAVDATKFTVETQRQASGCYGILQDENLLSNFYPCSAFSSCWELSTAQDGTESLYYDEYTFLDYQGYEIPQRDEAELKRYQP